MFHDNPGSWPPPPERLQPMDDDDPHGIRRWGVAAALLLLVIAGVSLALEFAPGDAAADEQSVAP